VLHGPPEDGTVQGLLKLANVPFVGAGVLGSAVGMDKDVMKRLLRDARIPTGKFLVFQRADRSVINFAKVKKQLGLPLFVKPANMGSSVGISKVGKKREFPTAIEEAFRYDNKIIIEEFIAGREIECSVLGNDEPIASLPGEIVVQHDFYSYDAKYVDDEGARLEIPARLPRSVIKRIQEISLRSYRAHCGCTRFSGSSVECGQQSIPFQLQDQHVPEDVASSGILLRLIDRLIHRPGASAPQPRNS
jgi:D-alanine-D-alanine ligase